MPERQSVKINNGALDEFHDDLVLRGTIDPSSFGQLLIADYQRETLAQPKIEKLKAAHLSGRLPDVELSLRDSLSYSERNGAFYLTGELYVVDGQQRITAACQLMEDENYPDFVPRLGALIHFGHDAAWELQRFDELNLSQTKLSPNITLRNLRGQLPVASKLYNLCTIDRSFVLRNKVTFTQNAHVGELMSATSFYKVIGMLHSHIGPGRSAKMVELAEGLQKIMTTTGPNIFTGNVRTFFEVLDGAWGVQHVAYRNTAVHLRLSFMLALAKVFSEHLEFWQDEKLVVDSSIIRKLSGFKMLDPTIVALAGSGGSAIDQLTYMLTEYINSGKRTKRLKRRNFVEPMEGDSEESGINGDA